jgi:hypothetical protein
VDPVSGAVSFTPLNGLRDTVSIDYVVTDGNGLESIATLTIIVDCPMPVTLVAFDAKKEESSAHLTWSTTEEVNSHRFEIERSSNGKVWFTIGSVRSNGESSILRNYDYTDDSPEKGENLYRLRMVDLDGTYAFSAIRTVSIENGTERISAYPNPVVNGKLTISIPGPERYRAEITTLTGSSVLQQSLAKTQELNLHGFASGMYVLRVISTSGDVQTKVFVVK